MGLETDEGEGGSSSLPKERPRRMSGDTEVIWNEGEGELGEGFYCVLKTLYVAGQGNSKGGGGEMRVVSDGIGNVMMLMVGCKGVRGFGLYPFPFPYFLSFFRFLERRVVAVS